MPMNKWCIAAVAAMAGVIPSGFAVAVHAGGNTASSDVAGLSVMLVAISCGVIASKRGSRWWLVVPVLTTLWACLVVLQMVVGE
jgi:hypothetical protein